MKLVIAFLIGFIVGVILDSIVNLIVPILLTYLLLGCFFAYRDGRPFACMEDCVAYIAMWLPLKYLDRSIESEKSNTKSNTKG